VKLAVIGCGYLGAVHAAAMAKLGHEVVGVDLDQAKIAVLSSGQAPFYEPGFPELLTETISSGRLRFTTDVAAVGQAAVVFVCVGTPQAPGSDQADLSFVDSALTGLLKLFSRQLDPRVVIVGKSTVPVGTAAAWAQRCAAVAEGIDLVWNPEFLREGFAVHDTLHPDRLVYGLAAGPTGRRAAAVLDQVYAALLADDIPKIETDFATAELVKVAANAFLATKISFINAMSEICDVADGNVYDLAQAIGVDARIGRRFLRAGIGFGGGCLPKDIRAFYARADQLGVGSALDFLRSVDQINLRARQRMVDLVVRAVAEAAEAAAETRADRCLADPAADGGGVAVDASGQSEAEGEGRGCRLAILGVAFKPESDDMRDSPALAIARELHRRGAEIVVYDPAAGSKLAYLAPELTRAQSLTEAAQGAQALVVLTEWSEFVDLDPADVSPLVAQRLIIDGRGALDPTRWSAAGWACRRLGAPADKVAPGGYKK
jgi:UDPglucose 6-dehydrogenase